VIYPAAPENTFGAGQVGADSGFAQPDARGPLFAATVRPYRSNGVINIWQAIFGVSICVGLVLGFIRQTPALAWGDTGHQVVALIARAHLTNPVRQKVDGMLAADRDPLTSGRPLTPHDMISAALWADRYRDNERSQPKPNSYTQTRDWHFVDIEIRQPNQQQACPQPGIPPGVAASGGPPNACVVDKIRQFNTELAAPGTDPQERIIALKFLLHFVGDVHQPLHSADDHDQGGSPLVTCIISGTPSLLSSLATIRRTSPTSCFGALPMPSAKRGHREDPPIGHKRRFCSRVQMHMAGCPRPRMALIGSAAATSIRP
jgi:hypothetical protein